MLVEIDKLDTGLGVPNLDYSGSRVAVANFVPSGDQVVRVKPASLSASVNSVPSSTFQILAGPIPEMVSNAFPEGENATWRINLSSKVWAGKGSINSPVCTSMIWT